MRKVTALERGGGGLWAVSVWLWELHFWVGGQEVRGL